MRWETSSASSRALSAVWRDFVVSESGDGSDFSGVVIPATTAIAQRGEAKRTKDYEKADRILAQLELEGIGIDDLRRTWRYLPAPKTGYAPPPAEAEESW